VLTGELFICSAFHPADSVSIQVLTCEPNNTHLKLFFVSESNTTP
jgi:hypothetical protein